MRKVWKTYGRALLVALVVVPLVGLNILASVTSIGVTSGAGNNFGLWTDSSSNCSSGPCLHAQPVITDSGGANMMSVDATTGDAHVIAGARLKVNVSASVVRPANTTPYTAGAAICTSTSVNCTPPSWSVARVNAGSGAIVAITLEKNSTGANALLAAQFNLWLYSASPNVSSPAIKDDVAYPGPAAADITSGLFLGFASCTAPMSTSDTTAQVFFMCTLYGPNGTNGTNGIPFTTGASSQSIFGIMETVGAYGTSAPTGFSGETFTWILTAEQY